MAKRGGINGVDLPSFSTFFIDDEANHQSSFADSSDLVLKGDSLLSVLIDRLPCVEVDSLG